MGLISQHQLSTFSSPVNGTSPIDANTVRGNDNTVKTAYNAHDADTTIHVQNGAVATRPAASIAGQMWLASDAGAVYAYLDTGSAWVEVNYIRSTATSLPAGVVGSSLTSVGTLTGLTVSGTSSLQVVTATVDYATAFALSAQAVTATSPSVIQIKNGTGDARAGVIGSTGGVVYSGSTAYAAFVGNAANGPLDFFTNDARRGGFAASGAFDVASGLTVSAGGITVSAGTSAFQAVTVGGTAWGFDGISAAIGSVSGMRFNNASTTRLLTLFQSAVIGFGDNGASDANGSPGNIIIGNSTAPTGNPTTGGFLFSTSGALKWRGSSGTITTIAPA